MESATGAANITGADLYDALYQIGYHNGTKHHADKLFEALGRAKKTFGCTKSSCSVLDVGCSHGGAVRELWKGGWLANGVDVSQFAILAANSHMHLRDQVHCATAPCFQTSGATQLPFASASFDFVLSSDVLEHVEVADVPRAVAEITRVARKMAFLKISNRAEGGAKELIKLKSGTDPERLPKQLHATIRGPDFWLDHFESNGWVVHHMHEQEDLAYAKGLPWECCTYVMHPKPLGEAGEQVSAHARAYRANMSTKLWFRRANRCIIFGKSQC